MTQMNDNFDEPRFRKAYEWVLEQSELPIGQREWYQGHWRASTTNNESLAGLGYCGTTYCVAGKVCEDAGAEWVSDCGVKLEGRPSGGVYQMAVELLGISEEEADLIFYSHRDYTLEAMEEVAFNHGVRL